MIFVIFSYIFIILYKIGIIESGFELLALIFIFGIMALFWKGKSNE